jgi:hypothetical protein
MIDEIKKLQDLGLKDSHCAKELIRHCIRSFRSRNPLLFACLRYVDPSRNPEACNLSSFFFSMIPFGKAQAFLYSRQT